MCSDVHRPPQQEQEEEEEEEEEEQQQQQQHTYTHERKLCNSRLITPFPISSMAIYALFDLYPSPNILRVIKSRRIRWAGHVARMGERRDIQGFGGET